MKTSTERTAQPELQDLLEALTQQNLVYNGDFRYFSNRVSDGRQIEYNCPDGWVYDDRGRNGSIGFDEFTERCVLFKSQTEGTLRFSQALHEFPRWRRMLAARYVTAKVHLNVSGNVNVTVEIFDGVSRDQKIVEGPGDFEAEVQLLLDPEPRFLYLSIECDAPLAEIRISRAYANVGKVALKNLPCAVQGIIGERRQYVATEAAPAEELSLCMAPRELGPDHTRLDSVLNGRFGRGSNRRSLLPDLRGYFSRAWNNGSQTDPDAYSRMPLGDHLQGDHVGTVQPDDFRTHSHGLSFSAGRQIPSGRDATYPTVDTWSSSDTHRTGGRETRPQNIAELFTLKWA